MKVLFLVVMCWCWAENGDYKAVNTILNVISQCSSVTATSLFYQENYFTQLIYAFTFKNEPDIPSVRYKLKNYIVGVKISEKMSFKLISIRGPF